MVNAEEALELGINSLFIDLEEESGQPIEPLLRADGETVWVRIAFTAEAGADGDSQLGQIGISLAAEAHSRIALFLPGQPEETMETVLHRAAARWSGPRKPFSPQNALPEQGAVEVTFDGEAAAGVSLDLSPFVLAGVNRLSSVLGSVVQLDPVSVSAIVDYTVSVGDRFSIGMSRLEPGQAGEARYRFRFGKADWRRLDRGVTLKAVLKLSPGKADDLRKKIDGEIADRLGARVGTASLQDLRAKLGLDDTITDQQIQKAVESYRDGLQSLFEKEIATELKWRWTSIETEGVLCQWISQFDSSSRWDKPLASALKSLNAEKVGKRVKKLESDSGGARATLESAWKNETSTSQAARTASLKSPWFTIGWSGLWSFSHEKFDDLIKETSRVAFEAGRSTSQDRIANRRHWSFEIDARPVDGSPPHGFADLEYRLGFEWSSGSEPKSDDPLDESDAVLLVDTVALLRRSMEFDQPLQVKNLLERARKSGFFKKPATAKLKAETVWMPAAEFASRLRQLPPARLKNPAFVNQLARAYLPERDLFAHSAALREARFTPGFLQGDPANKRRAKERLERYLDLLEQTALPDDFAEKARREWRIWWWGDGKHGRFIHRFDEDDSAIRDCFVRSMEGFHDLAGVVTSDSFAPVRSLREAARHATAPVNAGGQSHLAFRLFLGLLGASFSFPLTRAILADHGGEKVLPLFINPQTGDDA